MCLAPSIGRVVAVLSYKCWAGNGWLANWLRVCCAESALYSCVPCFVGKGSLCRCGFQSSSSEGSLAITNDIFFLCMAFVSTRLLQPICRRKSCINVTRTGSKQLLARRPHLALLQPTAVKKSGWFYIHCTRFNDLRATVLLAESACIGCCVK